MSRTKRVAIYARYSTDRKQGDRSVDDQWAACKAFAERQGWEWREELLFSDRAKTSATLRNRPGLMVNALGAIEKGEADILLAEATDRLSRGMSDMPWLWEQVCVHAEKELWTFEGQVDDIRAAIDGWRGSRFLKDLKAKTRRGATGGLSRGQILAVPYGYKVSLRRDAAGNLLRDENGDPVAKTGHREINDDPIPSAPGWTPRAVVVRIYTEYAEGVSPRAIAAGLNRDGIPSPAGGAWYHSAFICNRKGGMLNNQMYIGRHIYNEFRKKENKRTGGDLRVRNPENEHTTIENPAWRIVPQELWDAAHKVRAVRSQRATGGKTNKTGADAQPLGRNNDSLLAGRFLCSECEAPMVRIGRGRSGAGRIMCRTARIRPGCKNGCAHTKSYDVRLVEADAISQLLEYLRDPGRIRRGIEEYQRTYKETIAKAQSGRARKLKELANVEASYAHIFKLVCNPQLYTKDLEHELEILTHKRDTLRGEAKAADAQMPNVEIHPAVVRRLLTELEEVEGLLSGYNGKLDTPQLQRCAAVIRAAIGGVAVFPQPVKGGPVKVVPLMRPDVLSGQFAIPAMRTAKEILGPSAGRRRPDATDIAAHIQSTWFSSGQPTSMGATLANLIPLGPWLAKRRAAA